MRQIGLIGLPRSGTTWIAKIFDSHPDILYRHEPDTGPALARIPFAPRVENALHYREPIDRFRTQLPQLRTPRVAGKRPVFVKQHDTRASHRLRAISVATSRLLSHCKLELPVLEGIPVERYAALVWKSIQSAARLGVLARCAPDCRFIHITRHPCGYVASILRGERSRRFAHAYRASEDLDLLNQLLATPQGAGYGLKSAHFHAMQPEERLAWIWVLVNQKAAEDSAGLDNVMHLRYEDMCFQAHRNTVRAFEFSGLTWHPQTGDFLNRSIASDNPDFYSVFKNPVRSANAWQSELDSGASARVMAIVRNSRLAGLY